MNPRVRYSLFVAAVLLIGLLTLFLSPQKATLTPENGDTQLQNISWLEVKPTGQTSSARSSGSKHWSYWFGQIETRSDLYALLGEIDEAEMDSSDKQMLRREIFKRCKYLSKKLEIEAIGLTDSSTSVGQYLETVRVKLREEASKSLGDRTFANPSAIGAYIGRCESLFVNAHTIGYSLTADGAEAKSPILLATEAIDRHEPEVVRRYLLQVLEAGNTWELGALGGVFSQVPSDLASKEQDIESLAWMFAECAFGESCERGSLTMLAYCSVSTNYCDESMDLRSLMTQYFSNDTVLSAEFRAGRIVSLIQAGKFEQLIQLEHRR